jgi:hypothetical protein
VERDQVAWSREWQRPEQDGLHHAEDGSVEPNAERKGEDRDGRESRLTEKAAGRDFEFHQIHAKPRHCHPHRGEKALLFKVLTRSQHAATRLEVSAFGMSRPTNGA